MNQIPHNDEAIEKQKQFLTRVRRGVLEYLRNQGGKLAMADMHEFSMKKFLVAHQRFSEMMEFFVGEGLVEFDWASQEVTITDAGQSWIEQTS